jgi:hypothetical protein
MEGDRLMPITQTIDVSQLSGEARRVFDAYYRSRGIYERTVAAMGRVPRYRVTMASTTTAKIGDDKRRTP